MQVRFYGVRGSTPVPGMSTARYGGNTVCVEVVVNDGTTIILDAGTGIRELGRVLLGEGRIGPLSLLLTHLHWDHIIGFPFFGPIWNRDAHLRIYPAVNEGQRRVLANRPLFDGVHFPVRAQDVPARFEFLEDEGAVWRVGSARVTRVLLNHPGGAQGFRIDDADGHSLAYLTDNELSPPGPVTTSVDELARFASKVDLMIHDAQYTAADMPLKHGWGHSVVEDVLELGRRAQTPHLVLFHHEPDRDDDALDAVGASANAWLEARGAGTRATVAREDWSVSL